MITIRRVVGSSMEPALHQGAVVFARRKNPKAGDIVIAKAQGREVIKRITCISPARLFLQGDNSMQSTDSRQYGPVEYTDVIGVVCLTFNNRYKK